MSEGPVGFLKKARVKTVLLGATLLFFLIIAYVENVAFFGYFGSLFANPLMAVAVVFIHNVLVVSLILLAMTFYVELVLSFFKPKKYERIVLEHPRPFAAVYTSVIILLSILRASTIVFGSVVLNGLATIILLSLPNGIIEGYGIYLTIHRTLNRNITTRGLSMIYALFFIAALLEVGFIQLLLLVSA
jgi:uncharacterized membrane protein